MNPQELQDYESYHERMQQELQNMQLDQNKMANAQASMFNSEEQQNLIRWQLDLREDLDRIYHLLKGDVIGEDENGNIIYVPAKDPNLKPFNEFGVQLIMNIMSFYLNRNTILSNYSDEIINWKVLDFGYDLSDLIHNKYEDMMLTVETEDHQKIEDHLAEKLKLMPMIVRELVDTVHSAYLRAYNGGERESLRTARTVTQSEPMGNQMPQMNLYNQPKKKWYNPASW